MRGEAFEPSQGTLMAKKRQNWAVMVAVALLCTGLTAMPVPATASTSDPTRGGSGCPPRGESFWGIAHQGAHDSVNGDRTYRNTLPAWRRAQNRCQWPETDLRFTRDRVPVMVHDQSTRPMFAGRCDLQVAKSTLERLRNACRNPDGSTVATLSQYLKLVKLRGLVEIKSGQSSDAQLKKIIRSVYAHNDEKNVFLESPSTNVLNRIDQFDNNAKPIRRAWKDAGLGNAITAGRVSDVAILRASQITRRQVNAYEARGVRTVSAGTNRPATWRRLASVGAFGTLTDRSRRMFRWQNSR